MAVAVAVAVDVAVAVGVAVAVAVLVAVAVAVAVALAVAVGVGVTVAVGVGPVAAHGATGWLYPSTRLLPVSAIYTLHELSTAIPTGTWMPPKGTGAPRLSAIMPS